MTRTVSGRMSSSRSTSFTRRLPASSTSRRGLRSTTFIASRPRESRRRFHVEDLLQMTRLVARLQAPPLAEVHLAETEVLERQPARVTAGQPLDRLAAPRAGRLHRREQLGDRLAVSRPHERRRLRRARRRRRRRRELAQAVGEDGRRAARLDLLEQLRRQLAGGGLRRRHVIDDLADRPLALARLPVGLALGQSLDLAQHVAADALELVPQPLAWFRKGHRVVASGGLRCEYTGRWRA